MKNKKLKAFVIAIATISLATTNTKIGHAETSQRIYSDKTMKKVEATPKKGVEVFKNRRHIIVEETIVLYNQKLEEQRKAEEEKIKKEEEARREEESRKKKVGINLSNLLEPSYIKPEELYEVFSLMDKPEMAKLSWALTSAEEETGINAIFIASLVANESAYAESSRAVSQNNVTGFAVYNKSAKGTNFNSKEECIKTTAKWIKEQYLSPEGKYFYGYATRHVNVRYCLLPNGEVDYNWSKTINNIGKTIESYYIKYVK